MTSAGEVGTSRLPRDLLVADLDPASRGGWLLRTSRKLVPGGQMPLAAVAAATGISVATLSRIETGKQRRGDAADAYERVLGLPAGQLRGTIDMVYRTFPRGRPDAVPGIVVDGVEEMSRLTEQLLAHATGADGATVAAGDWLAWARALQQHGGLGLPRSVADPLCAQLVSDTSRSTGPAYALCYEALSRLVCSVYGDVAVEAIESWLLDPDVQVLYSVLSAACEDFTPRAITLVQRMLLDPRPHVKVGAARGIENLAQIDPTGGFWHVVCQEVLAQCAEAPPGSVVRMELSHLIRMMPDHVKKPFGSDEVELTPPPKIPDWVKTRSNAHWGLVTRMADRISDDLGLEADDTLPELLFDLFLGPHHTRAITATVLVNAVPDVARRAFEQAAELAENHSDPSIRRRVTEGVCSAMATELQPRVRSWLAQGPDERREWALLAAGAAGHVPPAEQVEGLLAKGGFPARRALYSAGMAQSDRLEGWRDDPRLPAEVRGAAAWWIRVGGVRKQ